MSEDENFHIVLSKRQKKYLISQKKEFNSKNYSTFIRKPKGICEVRKKIRPSIIVPRESKLRKIIDKCEDKSYCKLKNDLIKDEVSINTCPYVEKEKNQRLSLHHIGCNSSCFLDSSILISESNKENSFQGKIASSMENYSIEPSFGKEESLRGTSFRNSYIRHEFLAEEINNVYNNNKPFSAKENLNFRSQMLKERKILSYNPLDSNNISQFMFKEENQKNKKYINTQYIDESIDNKNYSFNELSITNKSIYSSPKKSCRRKKILEGSSLEEVPIPKYIPIPNFDPSMPNTQIKIPFQKDNSLWKSDFGFQSKHSEGKTLRNNYWIFENKQQPKRENINSFQPLNLFSFENQNTKQKDKFSENNYKTDNEEIHNLEKSYSSFFSNNKINSDKFQSSMYVEFPYERRKNYNNSYLENLSIKNYKDKKPYSRNKNEMITSFGLILISFEEKDENKENPYCLIYQRRDTYEYMDLIRGIWNSENRVYELFSKMSTEEIKRIQTHTFEELWNDLWLSSFSCNFHGYYKAKAKFESLKNLIEKISPQQCNDNINPPWGFPKGRKRFSESKIQCAKREFREETGIYNDSIFILSYKPLIEIFKGGNGKMYRTCYYIAYTPKFSNISKVKTPECIRKEAISIESNGAEWLSFNNARLRIDNNKINLLKIVSDLYKFYV